MTSRAEWDARHRAADDGRPHAAPSPWVIDRVLALPPSSLVLDLACGRGRHALPLARAGMRVVGVDFATEAIAAARRHARGTHGRPRGAGGIDFVVADVASLPLRGGQADAVLCVNYLDRSLVPRLAHLLRPGGRLIIETFTTAQPALGRGPANPDYLLQPGELRPLVAPLHVVEYSEGLVQDDAGERYVGRMVAVNEAVAGG